MSLSDRELARRSNDSIEVRAQPLRLRFRFEDLPCADSHLLRVNFACSVELADNAIDRRVFAETFLTTRSAVTDQHLVDHFSPALRAAVAQSTPTERAEQWLAPEVRDTLVAVLRKAAEPLEFDAGLKLLGPFELTTESDSFRRARIEQTQRDLAEKRAEGQLQHVQRSAELLKQFQALRQAAPDLSAGAVLERLSAGDRADMYEALTLAGESDAQPSLWAVAGNELLRVDVRTNPAKIQRIELSVGPFRSVQADELNGRRVLLLGGRDCIVIFDPADQSRTVRDVALGITPQLGFNRVAAHGDRIWATHGELGVIAWNGDGSPHASLAIGQLPTSTYQRPSARISGSIQTIASAQQPSSQTAGPRNITALDGSRLIFSVGNRLCTIAADESGVTPLTGEVQADVMAIFVESDRVIVVHDNGAIHLRDRATLELIAEQPRAGTVCSAGLLPWMGETRLLLAREDGCIACVGMDDSVVSEYRSPYRDMKDLAAGGSFVAAITGDRSRVVLWRAWDGRRPFAELHVSSLTRRRVGDVTFG